MSERDALPTWNWRDHLTSEEEREVAKYDRAMEKVRAAQANADRFRVSFQRIQNRAIHRAKFRAQNPQSKRRARSPQ